MSYHSPLLGAIVGLGVAVGISIAMFAATSNIPGDNGGSSMAVCFCVFPTAAVICGGVGLFIGRRRRRQYFDDLPGATLPRPRQRPFQRQDGSF